MIMMPKIDNVEVSHSENSFSLEDSDFSSLLYRVIRTSIWQFSQKSFYLALFGTDEINER